MGESQAQCQAAHVDHFCPGFFRAAAATVSCRGEFLDFFQSTIVTFYKAVPSESVGVEYPYQIVKLHPLQEILLADLVFGGDPTHLVNQSWVITFQVIRSDKVRSQVSLAWNVILLTRIVNYPTAGDGKWAGGKDLQKFVEVASCDTSSCDSSEFTTTPCG